MLLKNARYGVLADKIKRENLKVIIYGAGMIGQIVVPYIIETYKLYNFVDCYVDLDARKKGKSIKIGKNEYEIRHPDYLKEIKDNAIILVTNSKFYNVVDYLDSINNLNAIETYIIPVMQLYELPRMNFKGIKKFNDTQLIPQRIHYCWFGKKTMPPFLLECINSWKRFCPDYEIIEWNEHNYDVKRIPFAEEAYTKQRFGFVSDAARLDILYQYGGIYMDTDVFLLKNLDELLYQSAFVGVEKWGNINTGGLSGAVPGHPMIKEMLDYRKRFHFVLEDGSLNTETNGFYETMPFIRHGMKIDNTFQIINDMTVYPSSVFHPYDYMSCEERIESWTISKHYFYGGWMEKTDLNNRTWTQQKYQEIMQRMTGE